MTTFNINSEHFYIRNAVATFFWEAVNERRPPLMRSGTFKTNATLEEATKGYEPKQETENLRDRQAWWITDDGCMALASTNGEGSIWLTVAGDNPAAVDRLFEVVRERCPRPPFVESNNVPVVFWMDTANGPSSRRRKIDVQPWDDVKTNYPSTARDPISTVIALDRPTDGGKLILWHGEPGTGKTNAIRSVAKEWAKWCDLHYIVDPEKFFGDGAYLMNVLLNDDEEDNKWRLLVIEDADEFLVSDAKKRSGQALSRLLNATDGLIGQGLRVLTLITTNEKLTNIHPAVAREGRCLANIEFPRFSRAEARQWLQAHNLDELPKQDASLAELYEAVRCSHIKLATPQTAHGHYL